MSPKSAGDRAGVLGQFESEVVYLKFRQQWQETRLSPYVTGYYMLDLKAAAAAFAVELIIGVVPEANDLEAVVLGIAREPNVGLVVMPDIFTFVHRKLIMAMADKYRVPAIYPYRHVCPDGGLESYAPDLAEVYPLMAEYVDRILKGANPADLPVQTPTRFETAINLKTAKALGLTVPATLLATADDVIEADRRCAVGAETRASATRPRMAAKPVRQLRARNGLACPWWKVPIKTQPVEAGARVPRFRPLRSCQFGMSSLIIGSRFTTVGVAALTVSARRGQVVQSSSAARFTVGAVGCLTLIQWSDRPDLYGASDRGRVRKALAIQPYPRGLAMELAQGGARSVSTWHRIDPGRASTLPGFHTLAAARPVRRASSSEGR